MRNKAPMPVSALRNISARSRSGPHAFLCDFRSTYSTVRYGSYATSSLDWRLPSPSTRPGEPAARRHIFNCIKIKIEINIQFIYLLHKYPERLRCPRARPHLAGLPTLARRRGPGGLGPSGVLKVQVARQSRAATCTDALFCVPEFHAN